MGMDDLDSDGGCRYTLHVGDQFGQMNLSTRPGGNVSVERRGVKIWRCFAPGVGNDTSPPPPDAEGGASPRAYSQGLVPILSINSAAGNSERISILSVSIR